MTQITLTDEEKKELCEAVKQVIKSRQNNGIMNTIEQEIEFLLGAYTVMQKLTGNTEMFSMNAFLASVGRSVTDFKYPYVITMDANGKPKFKAVKKN